MQKQPVFAVLMWSDFLRISCVTALLLTLGACGSSGDDGTGSGSGAGSGNGSSGSGDGSGSGGNGPGDGGNGTGSAPAIKFLAANDGVNGTELWKTDGR